MAWPSSRSVAELAETVRRFPESGESIGAGGGGDVGEQCGSLVLGEPVDWAAHLGEPPAKQTVVDAQQNVGEGVGRVLAVWRPR